MDCPEARVALGVYVLGAIEPAERALVDAHLTTCRDCRDELAGLAGLPALLSRVSNEEAIALAVVDEPFPAGRPGDFPEPPRELLATVLDLTSARRRRRRRLQAAAGIAAALVIGAGIFGGVGLGSSPAHPPTAAIGPQYVGPPNGAWLTAAGQSGTMTATVGYRPMGWGTQLAVKVTGVPVGTDCQLWVVDAAGNRMLAGGWQTDNDEGTVWYPGSAALVSKNVAAFQVTLAHGKAIEVKA
ncbi:MAG TPA: zf-HC2 domain-containing protein [Trebonia sp.]